MTAETSHRPVCLEVPELTPGARRIVEAATSLFYRHGIHAVGVEAIAKESGVTKRTLYDRFGSKDTLIRVYLQARHRAWWTRLQGRLAETSPPRVLAVFDAYTDDLLPTDRGCGFLNAAAELSTDHPGYPVIRAHKLAVRQLIAELLCTEHPRLTTAEGMADQVFLLLEGAIAHRGIEGDTQLITIARSIAARLIGEDPAPTETPSSITPGTMG